MSICVLVHPSFWPTAFLTNHLSVHLFFLFIYILIFIYVCMFQCSSVYMPICFLSTGIFASLLFYPPLFLSSCPYDLSFLCLFFHLSILSANLYFFLSVYLFSLFFFCLPLYICILIFMLICLFIHMSYCLSVVMTNCLSVRWLFVILSNCQIKEKKKIYAF